MTSRSLQQDSSPCAAPHEPSCGKIVGAVPGLHACGSVLEEVHTARLVLKPCPPSGGNFQELLSHLAMRSALGVLHGLQHVRKRSDCCHPGAQCQQMLLQLAVGGLFGHLGHCEHRVYLTVLFLL